MPSPGIGLQGQPLPASVVPDGIMLRQNYPNPFNPTTTIGFSLAQTGRTRLAVFDLLGRRIATLVDTLMSAGYHEAHFDGKGLPSGIYVYVLQSNGRRTVRQMTLIR